MSQVILPLQPSIDNYSFTTTLENTVFEVDVHWNTRTLAWYMDWYQADGVTVVALNLKVVLGTYIGKHIAAVPFSTGIIVAQDTSGNGLDAGFDDIGVNSDGSTNRVIVKYIPVLDLIALRNEAGV